MLGVPTGKRASRRVPTSVFLWVILSPRLGDMPLETSQVVYERYVLWRNAITNFVFRKGGGKLLCCLGRLLSHNALLP